MDQLSNILNAVNKVSDQGVPVNIKFDTKSIVILGVVLTLGLFAGLSLYTIVKKTVNG